jgi:quercetin dioxygenase-like cupin family protein
VSEPVVAIKIVDNVFVKMMHFLRVGDTHQGHAHTFDHITLLAQGEVLMTHDGGEQTFTSPHLIVTPKGITHQFKSLTDGVLLCCIHAIRDGDAVDDVADPHMSTTEAIQLLKQYPLT